MTYTGDVQVGGPADHRELQALSVTKLAVDEQMANNAYLLRCKATSQGVLIDAADDPASLVRLIGAEGIESVITTHQHWDHHRALDKVVRETDAEVVAGAADAAAITEQTGVEVTRSVEHGDTIAFGEITLEVIALAGHTPGSIALLYRDAHRPGEDHLFTGDSLFPGGVGNTFGDDAAFRQLIDEVETKVFDELGDDTWFYPGHGADSTLGAERGSLPEWRQRGY